MIYAFMPNLQFQRMPVGTAEQSRWAHTFEDHALR